jgi:hypothetical protein
MGHLHPRLTRRELLLKCTALGCLTAAPSLSLAEAVAGLTEPSQPRLQPYPDRVRQRTTPEAVHIWQVY